LNERETISGFSPETYYPRLLKIYQGLLQGGRVADSSRHILTFVNFAWGV
jgi:hypothetical protein